MSRVHMMPQTPNISQHVWSNTATHLQGWTGRISNNKHSTLLTQISISHEVFRTKFQQTVTNISSDPCPIFSGVGWDHFNDQGHGFAHGSLFSADPWCLNTQQRGHYPHHLSQCRPQRGSSQSNPKYSKKPLPVRTWKGNEPLTEQYTPFLN